jgi:deazaflavin-dependent oxidoreductase (nitroreductase family)
MTMPDDMLAHNRTLIEQFRADGGASMGNRPLLLLTTIGARSGAKRTSPMMYVRSDDRLLVIASNNGAEHHPDWFHNLSANPVVTVELAGDTHEATAVVLEGEDRDTNFARIVQDYPFFAEHQERATGRAIPVVALERKP